jgi:hypothetical protein
VKNAPEDQITNNDNSNGIFFLFQVPEHPESNIF